VQRGLVDDDVFYLFLYGLWLILLAKEDDLQDWSQCQDWDKWSRLGKPQQIMVDCEFHCHMVSRSSVRFFPHAGSVDHARVLAFDILRSPVVARAARDVTWQCRAREQPRRQAHADRDRQSARARPLTSTSPSSRSCTSARAAPKSSAMKFALVDSGNCFSVPSAFS
jgi:hypothetical protein